MTNPVRVVPDLSNKIVPADFYWWVWAVYAVAPGRRVWLPWPAHDQGFTRAAFRVLDIRDLLLHDVGVQ